MKSIIEDIEILREAKIQKIFKIVSFNTINKMPHLAFYEINKRRDLISSLMNEPLILK